MTINRRKLIKGALVSSAALAGGRGLQAVAGEDFPLGDLETHVRMRGAPDGERAYWYYRGTIFGNRWGEVTQPMLGVEGVSYSTMEALPGGRYRYRLNEAGYYSDPETGAIGEPVINPFTGERYTPKNYLSPQSIIFHPDLTVTPDIERLPPGLEYRGRIAPLRVFKDTVISSEDLFVRTVVPKARQQPDKLGFKVQTSLATLTASRRDLLNPALDFVPCQLNYQTLATFREWMNMGTQPGMMSWRMVGNKCRAEELPPAIASRIRDEHPGFFG